MPYLQFDCSIIILRIVKPVHDVPLSLNYRHYADLWKEQLFILKRSNKTKYESTNRHQLIPYEAYLF